MSSSDPLVDIPIRDVSPGGIVVTEVRSFRDSTDKARYLAWLAARGARRADWFGVAALMRREGITTLEQAHAWVRDRITYAHEPEEMLETPAYIARERFGDCDGQHTLLASMAVALGHSAALVLMGGTEEDPAHLGCLLATYRAYEPDARRVFVTRWMPHGTPAPAGWTFAETTVRARFGEMPIAAQRRLQGGRADLR